LNRLIESVEILMVIIFFILGMRSYPLLFDIGSVVRAARNKCLCKMRFF
jgi:hypothetical protein